jgi:hypothetical protein
VNSASKKIWEHMRDLGLGALAHANRHAVYAAIPNPRWPELSVLQAAHATELLIKARIAEEHPLLIFEQLPRPTKSSRARLDLQDLFERGRTFQWTDLPDRLWATTGISIPNRPAFDSFGKLRNSIQHFASPPGVDFAEETLRFEFSVVDPFIHASWGLFAIDSEEDPDSYRYFTAVLVRLEIPFLVSPAAAAEFEDWEVDWSTVSKKYRSEMRARVRKVMIHPS